jgi:hypothetical protein
LVAVEFAIIASSDLVKPKGLANVDLAMASRPSHGWDKELDTERETLIRN